MNLDFLNQNSLRNYPLVDAADRVSDDGLFTIPNTLMVDMTLTSPGNNITTLYISSVTSNASLVIIEISALGVGVFGTFGITYPLPDYNTDFTLTPGVLFPQANGLVTIGSLDDMASQPYGDFTFSQPNTSLLNRVFCASVPGVNYISFSDTQGNTTALTGYIQITANSNVQFRSPSAGVIYLDAGEDLGLNKVCATTLTPITTINGIPGDSSGNFTLIPQQCVSLTPAPYGLFIADTCGQPCMGCTEIDTLATAVNSLESSIVDMKNFTTNLNAAINQAVTLLNYQCQC